MEYYGQQGSVNGDAAIVVDEAKIAELVHEFVDSRTGGAHHLGQGFLADFGNRRFRLIHLPITGHQQQQAGKPLFAGVEQLVDQVFFEVNVA